ncbi:MAG TPA: helix-turn-helix transcriptional regulator [Tepidimicrobium sp.]|nr:helix-turn-helix transcriptional regulator [Tepidimicrobium sp.]
MTTTIGARLRGLRQKHSMTLRAVQDKTGLSVSHLSDVERGQANPSFHALKTLASCYGMSMSRLMEGVEEEKPTMELGPRCTRVACTHNTGYIAAQRLDDLENLRCRLAVPSLKSDGIGGFNCLSERYSMEVSKP